MDATKALRGLTRVNDEFAGQYRNPPTVRRPAHTVYGGAHIFSSNPSAKLGATALKNMRLLPVETWSGLFGLADSAEELRHVAALIEAKLQGATAVEDLRIDFEDGYGFRPDEEEDGHARSSALAVAQGMRENTLPPFLGIRIKAFTEECKARALKTLEIFLGTLAQATGGKIPENFVVTLPKVTAVGQVWTLARVLDDLEAETGITQKIGIDLMLEMPQAVLGPQGTVPLLAWIDAGEGRVKAAAFGTYDYLAGVGITAADQKHIHPAADFARSMLQVAASQTGLVLTDGATTLMPIPKHKDPKPGESPLTAAQLQENIKAMAPALRLHFDNCMHSLRRGWYAGWDLHPAQIWVRYLALYIFFRQSYGDACKRLKTFVENAGKASLTSGAQFDDHATGQGLLNFFVMGYSCGALTAEEVAATGLTVEQMVGRSFKDIVEARRV